MRRQKMEIVDSAEEIQGINVADADVDDRLGFIRKVLGIITVQLIITAVVTLIPLRNE